MANLFGAAEAPQYIGPSGQAIATKTSTGLLGMFPGTPDYLTVAAPAPSVPASGTQPPSGTLPPPPSGTHAPGQGPGIEVMVRIPGLLHLQGSLCLPPWLLESAPALLPLALHVLRQRIEAELCQAAPPAPGSDDIGEPAARRRDPGCERPETEARVWDRE